MAIGDTMTFVINDSSIGGNAPQVQVTITENANGTVTFSLVQLVAAGAYLGDLRGFFFDIADESLLGSLTTAANPLLTGLQQGNDTVRDLGGGANMFGLLGDNGGYDVGVRIGSASIAGSNDVRNFSFSLDSSTRDLTLSDFANVTFGVHLTSVGKDSNGDGSIEPIRNARIGESKTGETTFTLVAKSPDATSVDEDATATGNVLTNDTANATLDVLSVTGWTGGALGTAIAISGGAGATVTLNANGSWTVDASAADALAEDEQVTQTFTATVLQTHYADAAHTISDGAFTTTETFTVTITGANDVAEITGVDTGSVTEDGTLIASGDLDVADADHDESAFASTSNLGGIYGDFTFNLATGAWDYTLRNEDTNVQALNASDTPTDTLTVYSIDGSSHNVVVNITGANDVAEITQVGYYDMYSGQGVPNQATPITDVGLVAVNLVDVSAASLSGVDAVVVQNPNNSEYGYEFLNGLSDLSQWVYNGGILVIHDRYVDGAEGILPGIGAADIQRNFSENVEINFINDAGQFAIGPGGMLNDASLDNGSSSNHGFAIAGTLPIDAQLIQTTDNADHVVTFGYHYGQGTVIYSSIPLDYYLGSNGGVGGNMNDYAVNVMGWLEQGADLLLA